MRLRVDKPEVSGCGKVGPDSEEVFGINAARVPAGSDSGKLDALVHGLSSVVKHFIVGLDYVNVI